MPTPAFFHPFTPVELRLAAPLSLVSLAFLLVRRFHPR